MLTYPFTHQFILFKFSSFQVFLLPQLQVGEDLFIWDHKLAKTVFIPNNSDLICSSNGLKHL